MVAVGETISEPGLRPVVPRCRVTATYPQGGTGIPAGATNYPGAAAHMRPAAATGRTRINLWKVIRWGGWTPTAYGVGTSRGLGSPSPHLRVPRWPPGRRDSNKPRLAAQDLWGELQTELFGKELAWLNYMAHHPKPKCPPSKPHCFVNYYPYPLPYTPQPVPYGLW